MKLKLLIIFFILTSLTSCLNSGGKKRNKVDSSQPLNYNPYAPPKQGGTPINATPGGNGEYGQNGTGTGYGNGNEAGVISPGQPLSVPDYYSINNIIVHGTANPNTYAPPGGILWSSTDGVSSDQQLIFATNSRFNLRVRAQEGPAQNTLDTRSNSCQYINNIYNKLKVSICVRQKSGSCLSTHEFSDIPVGQVSKVKEFNVPISTQEPLVIEVLDVQWDYSCIYYGKQGFSNQAGYCPWSPVWDTQCVKFDIQFSTDDTKDFSGARY